MWKQKVGISLGNDYGIPFNEFFDMIKGIGFEAISFGWGEGVDYKERADYARSIGLEIQSMHAPFTHAAKLWQLSKEELVEYEKGIYSALEECKINSIPVMVMHSWIGFKYEFDEKTLNFENYDRLVNKAKEYGVKIAFENTEGLEYHDALMKRYADFDNVGFCWDSGHEMCYNYSQDLLAKYGNKLIMTHINDNLGIGRFSGETWPRDDLHLLPFDGVADWSKCVERLKKCPKQEILNLELTTVSRPHRHDNDIYQKLSLVEYFTEAYKRICKIAYMYAD